MIFSNTPKTCAKHKSYAESDFAYLDRSSTKDSQCIREVIEHWIGKYPDCADRRDLIGRFKSNDDLQHTSAAFELYIHELLLGLSYTVLIHPDTESDKSTKPDFLVKKNDDSFYLEAVQSFEENQAERSGNSRLKVVYDTINRLRSYDFFLGLNYRGLPNTNLPGRRLRNDLEKWLKSLDYDSIQKKLEIEGYDCLPKFSFEFDGWEVIFTAIPRNPKFRDKPIDGPIGLRTPEARWLSTWEVIRDSILEKGKYYGELVFPLVIAVNANVFHLDKIDVMEALFGKEQFEFNTSNLDRKPKMSRAPNGVWHGPNGIRNKNISAVLIGFDIKPWTFGVRGLCLYLNPWATYPLDGEICKLDKAMSRNGKITWIEGIQPKTILELPACYPGINKNS
jgi:hypothetical protein